MAASDREEPVQRLGGEPQVLANIPPNAGQRRMASIRRALVSGPAPANSGAFGDSIEGKPTVVLWISGAGCSPNAKTKGEDRVCPWNAPKA